MSDIVAKVVTALNWSRDILVIGLKFMVCGFFNPPGGVRRSLLVEGLKSDLLS